MERTISLRACNKVIEGSLRDCLCDFYCSRQSSNSPLMTDDILITPAYILRKQPANSNTVIFVNIPRDGLSKTGFVFTFLVHESRRKRD